MYSLTGVHPHDISKVWHDVKGYIESACHYNNDRSSAEDYASELLTGEKQLWLVKNNDVIYAVVITQIVIFPQKKCCSIDVCTGDGLEEWKHLLPIIEQWGKDNGCGQMLMPARIGMEKILKPHGYHKTHVVMEKEL